MFIKLNINPNGKVTNDCAIRAIATVVENSWYDVFDECCKQAR